MRLSILLLLLLTGCSSGLLHVAGLCKQARVHDKDVARVEMVSDAVAVDRERRLELVGAYATGVGYALGNNSDSNQLSVEIAVLLNDRVISLGNKPNPYELQQLKSIVDDYIKGNKVDAENRLHKKDKEIAQLHEDYKELLADKEQAYELALRHGAAAALQSDQYKATLSKMDSWFGLGAIGYGLKVFFTRSLYVCIGLLVVYLVLRFASMSSPAVAAVFGLFEQVISWCINGLRMLAPKASTFSNLVERKVFDGYRQTLKQLVDGIQTLKNRKDRAYTVDELTEELDKLMDTADKERIRDIKKELNYR
jgi:hypothetical protein